MAEVGVCGICAQPYTSLKRKCIPCPKCNYDACVLCIRKFLLELAVVPCCMNCKHVWTGEFLYKHFPKCFVSSELAKHRRSILLNQELSYLPEAVGIVAARKEYQRKIEEATAKLETALTHVLDGIPELKQLNNDDVNNIINTCCGALTRVTIPKTSRMQAKPASVPQQPAVFMPCPFDKCTGFIVKTRCSTCDKMICPDCHCENTEDHKCDQANIASVKPINEITRKCPKCRVAIFRTEGCAQMFCTNCHTGFDWNTGKELVLATIHNRHYFDWLASGGRHEEKDAQCDDDEALPAYKISSKRNTILYEIGVLHNQHCDYRMRHFITNKAFKHLDIAEDLRKSRMEHAEGGISRELWATRIYNLHNKKMAEETCLKIQDSLRYSLKAIFNAGWVSHTAEVDTKKVKDEVESVIEMFNGALEVAAASNPGNYGIFGFEAAFGFHDKIIYRRASKPSHENDNGDD